MGVQVDHRPDTRLAWGVGLVTFVCVAAPAVWAATIADRLPPEVARHWGTGGRVTGSWPVSNQLLVLGTITLLVAATCGTVAVVSRQPLSVRRVLAGAGAWTAVLLAVTQVGALLGQLDLADPRQAPAPGESVAIGAVLGLVVGALVAALAREPEHAIVATQPPEPALPRLDTHAATTDVVATGAVATDDAGSDDAGSDDGHADDPSSDDAGTAEPSSDDALADVDGPTWRATAAPSRGLLVVAAIVLTVSALPALAGSPWPLVFGAVVAVPLLVTSRFTVTVDGAGLRVRAAPLTLLEVPLEQVAGADVVEHLDPFWEFGGWGLRVDVHGRTGLVSRAGEALSVTRADGSEVVVTVDDARAAAATLNTLADRRHAATGSDGPSSAS